MIGESIGNFKIVKRIGGGGMGDVYLAEQQAIDTKVAIKLLKPEISRDTEHVQRFFNEARAVGKIKHSGTVKIFEGGFHSSGIAYLVMEFLEGETLAARIQRAHRLALGPLCDIGRQIASILGATHSVGITHRDLKPDNIFIVPDAELSSGERVKILDFGIAKLTGGTMASKPQTMGTMGTPAYMAPEQWGDSANVDARADAYSLGCVLFEMAGGRPPFVGASFADLCAMHLTAPPPLLNAVVPGSPPQLESLVARLLSKRREDRPTMVEVGRELEALGRDQPRPLDATLPPGAYPAPSGYVHVVATPVPSFPHTPGPSGGYTPAVPNPTPGGYPAVAPPSTTLGSAASQVGARAPRRGRALFVVTGVAVVGGGAIAIAIAASGGGGGSGSGTEKPTTAHDAGVIAKAADAAIVAPPQPDAAAPPPVDWREQVAQLNPFVELHGVTVLRHQVTNKELRAYVAGRSADGIAPLVWGDDDAPSSWITHERAQKYCRALDAELPTLDQWKRAAAGKWGITDAHDALGPLQEWTASVDNGLATVAGGAAAMTDAQRADALANPTLKQTETSAGAKAKPSVVASEHIGFRCAKKSGEVKTGDDPGHKKDDPRAACLKLQAEKQWKALETCAQQLHDANLEAKARAEEAARVEYERVLHAVRNGHPPFPKARQFLDAIPKDSVYRKPAEDALAQASSGTPPPAQCDVRDLTAEARKAMTSNNFVSALARLEIAVACGADATELSPLLVLASCGSRNTAKATKYFKLVPAARRAALKQTCLRSGIDPEIANQTE